MITCYIISLWYKNREYNFYFNVKEIALFRFEKLKIFFNTKFTTEGHNFLEEDRVRGNIGFVDRGICHTYVSIRPLLNIKFNYAKKLGLYQSLRK